MKSPVSSRRQFLRGSGVVMALPFLEISGFAAPVISPRRMVCVANPFGMLPDGFFPKEEGAVKELPFLLKSLQAHQKDFTILSHLDHGVSGGHIGCHSFLTGMRDVEAAQFPDRNISVDQRAAEQIGAADRPEVDALLLELQNKGGGFRDLVLLVTKSSLFQE